MEGFSTVPDELAALKESASPGSLNGTAPSTDLTEFLDTLYIDREHNLDCFGLQLTSDGFAAYFNCVYVRESNELFLQLMPSQIPSDRKVQRVCSQLANALVNLAEELGATDVHLCIKKGNKNYAVWMRSCLYVGFSLMTSKNARELLDCDSSVILRCKMDYSFEKEILSDGTASTYADSEASSPTVSPTRRRSLGSVWSLEG